MLLDYSSETCLCCGWLYKLPAEGVVIVVTLLHVLMTGVELLIHLEIIQDNASLLPVTTEATSSVVTMTSSMNTSSEPHDPGGSCKIDLHENLELAVQIIRYATLVLSALFFLEIICRITYKKKKFFKNVWQLFDATVVVLSLSAEIVLFLLHEKLLCYHVATEAAAFIVILRLWRIPQTCDIRKKEYQKRMTAQIYYLTQSKVETEKRCKQVDLERQSQALELQHLRKILTQSNIDIEQITIPNGSNRELNGFAKPVSGIFKSDDVIDSGLVTVDLERNDSDKNSKSKDSGIGVKDSFRSDIDIEEEGTLSNVRRHLKSRDSAAEMANDEVFDSDGSEIPVEKKAHVQKVEVQIEETSRQNQLPSITSAGDERDEVVLLRKRSSFEGTVFVNNAYIADDDDDGGENVDLDESRTYKSADGTPMTDL